MAKPKKAKAGKRKTAKATAGKRIAKAAKPSRNATVGKEPVVLKSEFVDDLKKVFEKHNWPGHPVGFVANPALAGLGLEECDPGPLSCPPGQTLSTEWVHCPDGSTRLRRVCV